MLTINSTVKLNTGNEMPLFGFGTWQLAEGDEARHAVAVALQAGYRLIDTAEAYENERSVGEAIRESGIPREEIFLTTKLANFEQGYDSALTAFHDSLAWLGTEYIDLYLIHWPATHRWPDAWRAMLTLPKEQCRAIGVSNFEIEHLEELREISPIMPAANQVPYSPYHPQQQLLAYCREHDIAFEGYSPLRTARLDDPRLVAIAEKHGKTPVQILLRWPLQHGVITIPKSAHSKRIRENAHLFDFALDDEDMAVLDALGD
ncbi:MAG: aldo/keto reductase [Armatimonadota bacterium]